MPRDSDKKVTIYVVNTVEDEDEEEDDDEEDIIQEEDDHSDDSDDDSIFIQKDHQTRSKVKIPLEKIPKIYWHRFKFQRENLVISILKILEQ